ncbi:MAG: outer spore coat protein CotE [Bacilli bacterium]|nr:outer spore coat protein CotE [Bacilli bacterium]
MSNYKEIVTKTVKSKCKKRINNNFNVAIDEYANSVLGCWIINHQFRGINNGDHVVVNGSYDINIWYSYDDNKKTNVYATTISYNDVINCSLDIKSGDEIVVKALKQPTVSNVSIDGNNVVLDVEKELGVEVIGDEIIKINDFEELDDYVEILDDETLENVNSEYLD